MSMPAPPGYQQQGQGTAGVTDAVSQLQNIARQLGLWVAAFKGRNTFGTFTMAAAATTVVPQPAVQALSIITLTATNAAAATLVGSAKSPYISAKSPSASFTVATASGVAAAGTETFSYVVSTPN
jgi:hypothetical protein